MQDNLKDILSNLSKDVDQEMLLLYLQGKLSAEQQHEIEKQMLETEFEADAMEGLETIQDKNRVQFIIDQLNHDLKAKTKKKKAFKEKLKLQSQPWLLITLVIILILVVISFMVLQRILPH